MSSPNKAREISVRIVIMVLHTMALGGGLALLALTYMSAVIYSSTGAVAVGEPTLVLTYEIIMIILVFVNSINHRIRLIVDIIVNFAMVGVLIVMLIIIIIVSLNFSSIGRDGASDAPSPLTIFLFVILPAIIVIILYGIPFVASAVISWMTCSSISNSVHEESRELGRQSSSPAADTNPHLTADCPPASLKVDDL